MKYLIWSIEHSAWWRPLRCPEFGHTTKRSEAGRYTLEQAIAACRAAQQEDSDIPDEAIVPE